MMTITALEVIASLSGKKKYQSVSGLVTIGANRVRFCTEKNVTRSFQQFVKHKQMYGFLEVNDIQCTAELVVTGLSNI